MKHRPTDCVEDVLSLQQFSFDCFYFLSEVGGKVTAERRMGEELSRVGEREGMKISIGPLESERTGSDGRTARRLRAPWRLVGLMFR